MNAKDQEKSSFISKTEKFEFYNNFWINMHHMLYNKAGESQDTTWKSVFEPSFISQLTEDDENKLEEAITYYRENFVGNSLLFNRDLYQIKRSLIGFEAKQRISDDNLSKEFVDILNSVRDVYEEYFWENHRRNNIAVLEKHLELVREFENPAFERISDLAQKQWPDGKVRVDITYYSNWAGAYTSINPEVHVVITSRDEGPESDWLELLFHEPSHSVISNDEYKVAETIQKVSEELGLDPPRNLWHSLLFYFSGVTVQDLLKERGIDYELYMIRNDVFGNHHEVIFDYMPAYVNGKVSLEESLKNLITAYNEY